MLRWIPSLIVIILMTGCSSSFPSPWGLPTNRASDRFAKGLDQSIASGTPAALRLVAEEDVQGAWGLRAGAIVELYEKNIRLSNEAARLNKEIDRLNEQLGIQQKQLKENEQKLSRTQETKERLSRDNEILEVTLERLRQALIDVGRLAE